ncbi:MAG: EamA family transporter [Egibacteraceae bacterium]
MAALLGLAAAVGYGAADFFGGWASRRAEVLPVVLWSQVAGLAVLLVVLGPLTRSAPTAAALGWGAGAGATIAVGLVVYFRGLARARMGVVTPITAVLTAALPVVVGLLGGERPSTVALAGVLVAVAAVGAVSLAPSPPGPPGPLASASPTAVGANAAASSAMARAGGAATGGAATRQAVTGAGRAPGVLEALVAGVAFGSFFVCMDRVGPGAAVWPLVAANATSLIVLAGAAVATGRAWRPARTTVPAVVASGVCASAASLAFLVAVRQGLLSLVSVLASLSPAVTVALARLLMDERLSRLQLAGLAAAVAGVGLIGAG